MKHLSSLVHGLITTCILFSMLMLSPAQPSLADTVMNADLAGSTGDQKPGKTEHVPDVLILEVMPGIMLEQDPGGGLNHKFSTNSPALDKQLSSIGVQSVKPIFPPRQAKKGEADDLSRIYRLKLKPNTDIEAAVVALSSIPDISFVEPDYIAVSAEVPTSFDAITIDDPLYSAQWGMAKINIEGAWDDTYGSTTVTIAIIDSGIDLTHIDLAGNLWLNPGEVVGNSLDDDNNGYVDDIRGWNFVSGNNDVSDEIGHGTLVAGVAGAIGGNAQGIVGVCPQCSTMPVKVMQTSGTANYSDVAAGVLYAAQKGAEVINISLGGYANSNMLSNAINTAVNTYGAVIVAGAGNDNLSTPFYPAYYTNVLAVAGTQSDDTKVGTSNYGAWVDVSAPGIDIRTTALGGGWVDNSGTSFASPFAAGLAGLLRTIHPTWNQATIRSQIVHTTDDIDSLNPTYAGKLGSGRLNAGTAMTAPHPLLSMAGYSVNGTPNGRPLLDTTAQLTVTLSNDWWDALGVTGTLTTTDSFVTIINGSASYGNIPAATSKTNATPFSFSITSGAGYNHPIPFKLHLTDTTGYSIDINFTVTTESGVQNVSGTIASDTVWTNDKTYVVTNNVGIPPSITLTIQPGTTVKFNGNFMLNVGGTLIADGTSSLPIQFKSNTAGTWNNISFSDSSADAQADGSGNYISGSILRYVNIEGTSGGIGCATATPYLSHVSLDNGGINCLLGATSLWLLDNNISGTVTITGSSNAFRDTISGGLSISGAGIAEDNIVTGSLSLGSGIARRNKVGGTTVGLTIGGSGGSVENNTVSSGNVSLGDFFNVVGNTLNGNLTVGNGAMVDHNTVSDGITVGASATVTWNNAENENASGTGLTTGDNVTARYNRLIGNATGMIATSGLIEHNLIANNTGVGLQVNGNASITNNTLTGNGGNAIVISSGGMPVIHNNNLEFNTGQYDLYNNSANDIDASSNWWGTTDSGAINTRIYDYWDGDFSKGKVAFEALLADPDQTAPAYVRSVTVLPDTTLGIQTGIFEMEFSRGMDEDSNPAAKFYSTQKDTWQTFNLSNSGLTYNQVSAIAVDTAGNKWFGTYGGGVSMLRADGTWQTYNTSNSGLADNSVYSIAVDAAGNKWFGTSGGGVSVLRADGMWQTYNTSNSGLANNAVYIITVDSMGNMWFCTWNSGSGVSVLHTDGTWQTYSTSNSGLLNNDVFDITLDAMGNKWFATYGYSGVSVLSAEGIWKIYNTANSGLIDNFAYTIVEDGDKNKWFGTRFGASELRADNIWQSYNMLGGDNHVWVIEVDTAGNKWFGTLNDGGLNVLHTDGTWQIYNTSNSGLGDNNVKTIAVDAMGSIWFGTSGGVSVLWGATEYPITDSPQWLASNRYRASYDITSIIPKGTYRVSVVDAFDPDGMRVAPFSDTTFTVDYAGFISDKTPPLKPVVIASGDGSLTTLSASWSSSDPESPITKYRYAIGTTLGGRDVVAWTYTNDTSMTHTGLNLTAGVTYYVSVGARNEGGLWSPTGISNGVKDGIATAAFISNGTQDGWILESTETSIKGGTMNATGTTFYVGDDVGDKQYRSILSFNTAILPNTAVFTRVTLKFKGQSVTGVNPFTTHGNLLVDVYKGAFGANAALQLTDFQALPSKASIGIIPKTPVSGWYTRVWTSGIFPYINKLTVTQFRLRFTKDDNEDGNADIFKFFSGNYTIASARPMLIIEYYIP